MCDGCQCSITSGAKTLPYSDPWDEKASDDNISKLLSYTKPRKSILEPELLYTEEYEDQGDGYRTLRQM